MRNLAAFTDRKWGTSRDVTSSSPERSAAQAGRLVPIPRTPGGHHQVGDRRSALVGFLVYYVGPSSIGTTLIKVVGAVGISVALFVGANMLFNSAYGRWTQFATIAASPSGSSRSSCSTATGRSATSVPRPWLWALIGGAALGALMFLLVVGPLSARCGCPSQSAASPRSACSSPLGVDDARQPALDWAKLLICTGIGVAIGVGRRLVAKTTDPQRLAQRRSPAAGSAG